MKLREYLIENESVSAEIGAYDNPDSMAESGEGQLACTPYRLVYVNGDDVTDISLKGVNSIEYSAPGYPNRYLAYAGWSIVIALVVGAVGAILATEGIISSTIVWVVAGFLFVGGLATLIQGHFMRRSILKVNTPNKTYEFYSKESGLDEIGHTVRGYEMKD